MCIKRSIGVPDFIFDFFVVSQGCYFTSFSPMLQYRSICFLLYMGWNSFACDERNGIVYHCSNVPFLYHFLIFLLLRLRANLEQTLSNALARLPASKMRNKYRHCHERRSPSFERTARPTSQSNKGNYPVTEQLSTL